MAEHIPGLRFIPTDEEIVSRFLIPRIQGWRLPWDWIAEKDVYGAEPSIVFSDVGPFSRYWNTKREGKAIKDTIYVFIPVAKTSSNSKKTLRRAGSGTWSGQTGLKSIVHPFTGDVIGTVRQLSYQRGKNGGGPGDPNHWVMHEYSLAGAGLSAVGDMENNVVLCKITKSVKDSDRPRSQEPPPEPSLLPPLGFPVREQPPSYLPVADQIAGAPITNTRPAQEQLVEHDAKNLKILLDHLFGTELEGFSVVTALETPTTTPCASTTALESPTTTPGASTTALESPTTTPGATTTALESPATIAGASTTALESPANIAGASTTALDSPATIAGTSTSNCGSFLEAPTTIDEASSCNWISKELQFDVVLWT